MPARFQRFMALRYLRGAEGRAEGRSFLRFITYVAIGGIALGVAALLLALAIVRGFSSEIEAKIVGFGAHVKVQSYLRTSPLPGADTLAVGLRRLEGVTEVAPRVEHFTLLRASDEALDGVVLLGTDAPPTYLADRVADGAFDLGPQPTRGAASGREEESGTAPGLVVGRPMAERLGLAVGDRVTAFSMRTEAGGGGAFRRPRVRAFVVTGIYDTALAVVDETYAFTGLEAARRLAGLPEGAVSHFDLTLADVTRADAVAREVEAHFGFPVGARTIYEQYQGLFAWVNLQESIIPLVIGVIVVVAAFNIVSTLLMMILEKTREIGVLQSLGASKRTLRRLFLALGLLIGAVGTGLGSLLALALALLQKRYAIIPLPAEAYFMTTAPVELAALDFALVATVTLALSALAAYVPARVAARVEPVRAIRFE
jgi:lipoprotein-releasing system permease protein